MNSTTIKDELTDEAPVGAAIGTPGSGRIPTKVPTYRYISPEWAQLEAKRLWPRVWQLACTTSHLQSPGDFYEYNVGNLSILILCDSNGDLRAYQNVCRHRGNILCSGSGSGLEEIRCQYHRWSWTLEGKLREVPSRKGFGKLQNDDYPLFDAKVEKWGPLVFVNPDPSAPPLEEWLEAIPQICEWANIEEFACNYEITIDMPCNWKTLIEAFSETYHVQGIHREMLPSCDDVNSVNRLYGRHGSLYQPYGIPSPRIRGNVTNQDIWESLLSTQGGRYSEVAKNGEAPPCPEIDEGQTMRDALEKIMRKKSEARGLDTSNYTQSQLLDLFQFNFFPNISVIFMFDTITVIRARPTSGKTAFEGAVHSPDQCQMDILHLERQPPGTDFSKIRPQSVTMPAESASLNLVFDQDIENLKRAQLGLHQPGLKQLSLSREEMRIINLHLVLEEFLDISPSEVTGGTPDEIFQLRAKGAQEKEPTGINPPW